MENRAVASTSQVGQLNTVSSSASNMEFVQKSGRTRRTMPILEIATSQVGGGGGVMPKLEPIDLTAPQPMSTCSNSTVFRKVNCSNPTQQRNSTPARNVDESLHSRRSSTSQQYGRSESRYGSETMSSTLLPEPDQMDNNAFSTVYLHLHNLTRLCSGMDDLRVLLIIINQSCDKVKAIQRNNIFKNYFSNTTSH